MDRVERPLSPHATLYRWQITNTLSILHRLTGVFLSVGALVLVGWLMALAGDPSSYPEPLFASALFKLLAVAWTFCFFYHLGNGVRHLFWDVGLGFEHGQIRAGGWAVVAFAVIASAAYTLIAIL